MDGKWFYLMYLLWFFYLIISAILMFGQGFLLSRKTLSDVSDCVLLSEVDCDGSTPTRLRLDAEASCRENYKIRLMLSNTGPDLVCTPIEHRVVFVLVDALRYDFTEYDPHIEKPLHYQNKLPVIREMLERWPERTRLFRFMADPPTTTLQRVKALVTGSLPTFVDASSNFAAMELQEDNVIDQVRKAMGSIVILGDDTWARLIPKRWLRSHTQYSFHTWDLDTVDNEIDTKIYDELKKDDWHLLVAHYLGVDHAGHRYGPNHSEMARKLKETNDRLRKIIELLPDNAMLYVVGDHGMTDTDSQEWTESGGDHGGESKAERTAAFFAYYGAGFGGSEADRQTGREVQQTDLAPTLSAAFGRPPPAPSLGNLLFPVLPKISIPYTLLHLSNNLKQISNYLVKYGDASNQVSLDRLAGFINDTRHLLYKANDVETEEDLNKYVTDARTLIDSIRGAFREVWVEFDSLSMLRALLLLLLAIFFNWLVTEGIPIERIPNIFASSFVPCGALAIVSCTSLCVLGYTFHFFHNIGHTLTLTNGLVTGGIVAMLIIMHWDGITQRWYEGRTTFYERFSRAALFASAAVLLSNSYIIEEGAALSYLTLSVLALMAWNIGTIKAAAVWVACGAVLAVSRLYRGCREEQGDCWTSGGNLPSGQASRLALIMALGSMAAVVAVARRYIGWRGHGLVLAGLFSCAHWAVGWGSLGSPSRSRLLARGAWLIIISMFALLLRRDQKGGGATLPIVVCGLLMFVANSLVLGASYAPAAALGLLSGYLALNIVSNLKGDGSTKYSISTRCSSSVACMWALLASYQFYGTGHHATLGHVRWAPAFHAGDPHYMMMDTDGILPPYAIIASLVSLELFGMPLMFGATVPLLALWGSGGSLGPRTQLAAVFSLCLKFALCFAIRVFATAIAATIHCRHLMIWGVFTPKLLFECGACAFAILGSLIGASLTMWHLPTQHRTS